MDEMRMAKFEILIEDINNAIAKRRGGFFSSVTGMRAPVPTRNKNSQTPLFMIFTPDKLNEYALTICNKAIFELFSSNTYEDPWVSKYGERSFKEAKTRIEAAKDFVKYCREEWNRSEAYKFIFWSFMILSVENEGSDEWLSLICDFACMLRITNDELMDITYAVKCVYNEVEEEYVFKTEIIPSVLGNLFNL